MAGTILVTGGSGYIAGYLIRQLAEAGWTINTTVRSLTKEAAVRARLAVPAERLHVFAADLTSDAGWAEATAGCSHVAHVASPFPLAVPKNEDDLIVPARDGALRALRFAKGAGATRFVMTSSVAAVAYGHGPGRTRFTEADWTDVTARGVQPYTKSKTIAERAARDWVAREGGGIEFCSINPSAVLGPVQGDDYASSIQLVERLLTGSIPAYPDVGFGVVDVRDVADLHFRALTAPADKVRGERFIASGPFYRMADVGRILRERLGREARKVPTRNLPDVLVRLFALFDPSVRQITGELGRTREADASHARELLGWVPRPADETIVATARSLIDLGIVKV